MLTRVGPSRIYRAGKGGVRITWRDGEVTAYPVGSVFRMEYTPLKIEGRLYRVGSRTSDLAYEAPALEPVENKLDPTASTFRALRSQQGYRP